MKWKVGHLFGVKVSGSIQGEKPKAITVTGYENCCHCHKPQGCLPASANGQNCWAHSPPAATAAHMQNTLSAISHNILNLEDSDKSRDTQLVTSKGRDSMRESGDKAVHLFCVSPNPLSVVLSWCLWLQSLVCQISACLNQSSACLHILVHWGDVLLLYDVFVLLEFFKYSFGVHLREDSGPRGWDYHFKWRLSSYLRLLVLGEGGADKTLLHREGEWSTWSVPLHHTPRHPMPFHPPVLSPYP